MRILGENVDNCEPVDIGLALEESRFDEEQVKLILLVWTLCYKAVVALDVFAVLLYFLLNQDLTSFMVIEVSLALASR